MSYEHDGYRQPPPNYSTGHSYNYGNEVSLRDLSLMPRNKSYVGNQNNLGQPAPSLPEVNLPLYELPPAYVSPSERRVHADYCTDVSKFGNRTIHLQRNKPSDQLGFNVRGGAEHKCGIFVSKVNPRTDAYKAGLQEGDQILFANGESFLHINQHEAVQSLKRHVNVELIVKYFPYAYDKSFDKCKSNPAST